MRGGPRRKGLYRPLHWNLLWPLLVVKQILAGFGLLEGAAVRGVLFSAISVVIGEEDSGGPGKSFLSKTPFCFLRGWGSLAIFKGHRIGT